MSSSISQAFKGLNLGRAESVSEHENVYEVSYQYLSNVRGFQDVNSFHNCLVALINLDKYHKAFQLIQKVGEDVHSSFVVEKAYIYYKLGKTKLLEELYAGQIDQLDSNSIGARALKHIVAQNHYKEGASVPALKLYQELIGSNKEIDSTLDLSCNESAIISQSNFMGHEVSQSADLLSSSSISSSSSSYDLLFNQSLIQLSQNNFEGALSLLSKAESECLEQNVDSDAEDLMLEVTPIRLTVAYVNQILDNDEVAKDILFSLKLETINDPMIKLIVANNYYSVNGTGEQEILLERELNYQKNLHTLQNKLTKPQYQSIIKNHFILSYNSSTLSTSSSYFKPAFLQNWVELYGGEYTPYVYKVLTKLRISSSELEEDASSKEKVVYKFVTEQLKTPSSSDVGTTIGALFILFHLNHKAHKYDHSISILEKLCIGGEFTELKTYKPAFSGILIKIYETLNLSNKLTSFLSYLTENFRSSDFKDINYYNFAKIIGFKLISIDEESAKGIFQKLLNENSNDKLIKSVLSGDDSFELDTIKNLTSSATKTVEELLKVEIEDLIRQPANDVSTSRPSAAKTKPKAAIDKVAKVKRAKFSSKKIYKDEFDPTGLDKERWLPMKLRSYYKPSKKDKKKNAGGHQGVVEHSSTPTPSSSGNSSKKKKKGKK
ncbi:signal recognition particle subunit Srp72p [[Candida] railenensis]|uniref:Signal recognition particle subunit SRP72 n=1 Tax=[Candida] railenensis TaxID=45579 RepID=A0A9P0QM96_9ASCO|nr:signal recognition particle subunit Srp72p [[Candida] railenensis]